MKRAEVGALAVYKNIFNYMIRIYFLVKQIKPHDLNSIMWLTQ